MVNPLLLLFLPLALVPVILHLITRHRLRTVELSTFRFLVDSYVQQRRRVQLLEFLVMLLRFAFVILIVFTFARPVLERFAFLGGGGAGRDVAVIIDASPSMDLLSGGTTSLQRARTAAEAVIELLGSEDHVKVIRAGTGPEVLAEGFAARADRAVELLQDLGTDAGGADLALALEEVFAAKPHGSRVIYLMTDGLRRTWSDLTDHPVLEKLDDQTQVVVMNVGPAEPVANVAIVGDTPQTDRAVKGLPVLLNATVLNSSDRQATDAVLSVLLDDELVSQINLSLEPGQRVTRSLSVTPSRSGAIRGRFEVPADAFTADDAFLFCLNVAEKLDVLVVTGPPGAKKVEKPGLYLGAALSSPRRVQSSAIGAEEQRLAEALDVTTVRHDQLTGAMLNAADAVILADVPLDAARGALVRKYVEAGGGALVLPGPHVDPGGYAKHLLGRGKADAVPLALAKPTGDVEDESNFKPVTGLNLAHPVLTAFADEAAAYFSTVRLYRYFPLELPDRQAKEDAPAEAAAAEPHAAPRANVLMRLIDRTPIFVETALGEGRLLVAGFAATPDWSNLPLKPEFVPLLLRAVAHLQKPAEAMAPAAVAPARPAVVRLAGHWTRAQVQAIDPAGKPHAIQLHRSGASLVGAMLETDRKGYYTFEVLPRTQGAPERVELGFAVNLAGEQADFRTLGETEIRDLLARPHGFTYVRGSPEDPILAEQLTHKREIWRTLIWITFLVIGIEFLMATLRPQRRPTRGAGLGGAVAETSRLRLWATSVAHTLGVWHDRAAVRRHDTAAKL